MLLQRPEPGYGRVPKGLGGHTASRLRLAKVGRVPDGSRGGVQGEEAAPPQAGVGEAMPGGLLLATTGDWPGRAAVLSGTSYSLRPDSAAEKGRDWLCSRPPPPRHQGSGGQAVGRRRRPLSGQLSSPSRWALLAEVLNRSVP